MRIILANPVGFCFGVGRAVDMALKAVSSGRAVRTLGPIVHNSEMVSQLMGMGVGVADSLEGLEGCSVVIRAHGATPEVFEEAQNKGLEVIDATCPNVKRVQRCARELVAAGYQVVVLGDPEHAEVKGILGWADGKAVVVTSPSEAMQLKGLQKVGFIAQTTQRPDLFEEVAEALKRVALEVEVINTLCSSTIERQEAARRVARQSDVVLVLGDARSANCRRLVEICQEQGVNTRLVGRATEIDVSWFEGVRTVGVVSGASTPDWIIKEVLKRMDHIRSEEQLLEEAPVEELTVCGDEKDEKPQVEEVTPPEGGQKGPQNVELKEIHPGEIIKGKVVSVGTDNVLVDVGYKSEGIIPLWELSRGRVQAPADVVSVGEEISVYVLSVDGPEGMLKLSKKKADEELVWGEIEAKWQSGEIIEAEVAEEVKGGLILNIGVRAFMPASHVERGYVSDLGQYVGKKVRARIIEMDRAKNRVILSQKVVLEEEYQRLREETWKSIREGEVRRGTVKSITDFGAFVDIGGVDGLLHVSEMSWGRVNHPSEVLKEGDEIDVMVLRVDREKEKISLGLKQTLPDPWEHAESKYPVGSIIKGTVVRIVGFGAFVQLEPGVEGLVHISQLAPHRVGTPDEVVALGDEILVKVLRVSSSERRISLSLKEATAETQDPHEVNSQEKETENITLKEMFGKLLGETRDRMSE